MAHQLDNNDKAVLSRNCRIIPLWLLASPLVESNGQQQTLTPKPDVVGQNYVVARAVLFVRIASGNPVRTVCSGTA